MATKKLQILGSLGSDIQIDTTLTASGAAADSKVVGDKIANLETFIGNTEVSKQIESAKNDIRTEIPAIDDTLTTSGSAADAKATGQMISDMGKLVGGVAVSEQIEYAVNDLRAEIPVVDDTLTIKSAAADAQVTGQMISKLNNLVGTTPVADQINEAVNNTVKSVNGVVPDVNGNVTITIPDSSGDIDLTDYATQDWVQNNYAQIDDIPTTPEEIGAAPASHVSDTKNPHGVNTDQIGAVPISRTINGKALNDNISLTAADVGADKSGTAESALNTANTYTDTKIAALINSAPTTLDTLGEIATAMQENADVVEALESAIGSKADKSHIHAVSDVDGLDTIIENINNDLDLKATESFVTAKIAEAKLDGGNVDLSGYVTEDDLNALTYEDVGAAPSSHVSNKSNPHEVTAAQVGLGNVDNTSDVNKPVSTAQAAAISDAKAAGTSAQNNLDTHASNKSNPHGVTAEQTGAVPISRTVNGKTLSENISLTASDVGAATVTHGNHVPATQTADNTKFLRNDNTWQIVTPANIGAVPITLTINGKELSDNISLTASDVGLGNVNNTSDINKPVSTAQATAIADAKTAGTSAQENLNTHTTNKSNPHGVTKAQVGLGNVPNVSTNDQTPTYSAASTLATLTSGEKLSVSMGKIMKAITDFISHIGNKSNPHGVTASQAGAVPTSRTVNGKALSSNISLTASDVGAAATSHGNHVPVTQTADNATFLRNDNTWQKVTPSNIGAATSSHTHNELNVPTTGGMVALYFDNTTNKNHWLKPDVNYPTTQKINLGSTTSRTWDNLYVNDGIYVNGVACSLDGHSHEDIEEDIEYNLQYSRDLDSAIQTKVSNTVRINGQQLTGNVDLTASDVGAVPTTRKVNSKALSGDITLTASDVGAAASSHNHSASNITSGTLPIERGGTGATTASAAEYNILGALAESTTATTGSTPIVCRYAEPSTGGGVLYYKKASNIADYIKGTITPSGIGAAESSHTHTNFGSGTNKMYIASANGNVYPSTTETQQLGLNANKWGVVLCKSVTQSSDERIKENFSTDMDKYVAMLDLIEPTSYYFKSDADKEDRKRNVGYIAQRVQDALAEVGLEDSDFAALAYDKEEAEGTHTYGLDYSQFIPILHAKIKQVEDKYERRIAELEKTIAKIQIND